VASVDRPDWVETVRKRVRAVDPSLVVEGEVVETAHE
jgi:hypothetical protein